MQNLFTWKFWLNNQPPALLPVFKSIFIAVVAILVVAVFVFAKLKNKKGPYQKTYEELFNFTLTNGFIGLVLLFFNYEMITFFSARFWLALWFISMVVWMVFIIKQMKKIPERRKAREEEKERRKYLP